MSKDISLLNDIWIRDFNKDGKFISPFVPTKVSKKSDIKGVSYNTVSFGLSPMGYDLRLSEEVRLFNPSIKNTVIDPKDFNQEELLGPPLNIFNEGKGQFVKIPPKTFALSYALEVINMPKNMLGFVTCKSTYARCGLNLNNTTIQPGFEGHVVLELYNSTFSAVKVYIGEGIANLVLFQTSMPEEAYKGVYQNQRGITLPKI